MGWTLQNIRDKVRLVTGTPSSSQLDDSSINTYINNYYQFTMPFELKEQIQLQFLDFKIFPGTDVYDFTSVGGNFLTDQPMAYADGFPLVFYQDPDVFYQDYPQQYAVDMVATGTGSTVSFSGGLQNPPIIAGSLFITDGVTTDPVTGDIVVFQDLGNGTLSGGVGPSVNTINYTTGAFTVVYVSAPAASATIYAKYLAYAGNRPQGVLFFNNQFTFRPVPDLVYQIRMEGYSQPVSLTGSDTPQLQEWGQVLAYGASCDIFADRGDLQKYSEYYTLLKRYENVALARTIQQFQAEQSIERF